MKHPIPFLLLVAPMLLAPGPADAASHITNVSVRSTAGSGADTLIVGFTIGGSGNKQMLIRGIGPTLADFNVANATPDPQLRLFNQTSTEIAGNDNWGGSSAIAAAFASVGAFPLRADSRDAALITNLPSGSYSAHLAATTSNGIALVEAYDADSGTPTSQISNVSARSLAETGAGVLTVGFAIVGDTPRTVLIRAIGPSLTALGVEGALANPQLTLFGRSGRLGQNDDWLTTAGWAAAYASVGAFPLANGSRDGGLLVRLSPGNYSAQASGVNNTRGVALIEVYDVPNPPAASTVLQPVDNRASPPSTVLQPVDNTASPPSTVTKLPGTQYPAPLTQARPVYPIEMRVAGVSGEAVIDLLVDTDGRVKNAYVLVATDVRFGDAALAAVRQWTFRPGAENGRPVVTHMQVPIVFSLTEY